MIAATTSAATHSHGLDGKRARAIRPDRRTIPKTQSAEQLHRVLGRREADVTGRSFDLPGEREEQRRVVPDVGLGRRRQTMVIRDDPRVLPARVGVGALEPRVLRRVPEQDPECRRENRGGDRSAARVEVPAPRSRLARCVRIRREGRREAHARSSIAAGPRRSRSAAGRYSLVRAIQRLTPADDAASVRPLPGPARPAPGSASPHLGRARASLAQRGGRRGGVCVFELDPALRADPRSAPRDRAQHGPRRARRRLDRRARRESRLALAGRRRPRARSRWRSTGRTTSPSTAHSSPTRSCPGTAQAGGGTAEPAAVRARDRPARRAAGSTAATSRSTPMGAPSRSR